MLVCVSFFMGVRVSNQSNWCMGRIKEKKRVAAASRGQVHLNTLGIDAAIKAYRTAVLDSERMQEKIRELIRMGDFCREVCRDEEALDAYERALSCCRENENKRSPVSGRWLVIVRPVWMSYRLISEKIVRQWSVWLIFMQIILRACQKPFGTPSSL